MEDGREVRLEGINGQGRLIHLSPALLDYLHSPYTGAPADAMYLTSNKLLAKSLLRDRGIPTPHWLADSALEEQDAFNGSAFIIKAVWEHASVGLDEDSIITPIDRKHLNREIAQRQHTWNREFFAERYIDGREFNLSLLAGWKTVMSVSSPPLLAVDLNQSLFAFFYRFLTPTPQHVNILNLNYTSVKVLIYIIILSLFFFLLFLNRRSKYAEGILFQHRECIEYSLLLIFMSLFSPLGWVQNYSSSILAIMILIYYVLKTGFRDKFIVSLMLLFFILEDLINFEIVGRKINDLSLYLSFLTWGIFILIVCLSRLRLSRIA